MHAVQISRSGDTLGQFDACVLLCCHLDDTADSTRMYARATVCVRESVCVMCVCVRARVLPSVQGPFFLAS